MPEVELHCPSCKHNSPLPPQTCPHCGARMTIATKRSSLSPVAVIVILFLVLGPLGLGVLWRNDHFTRRSKWVLTVLVLVYTAVLFWAVYIAVQRATAEFDKAMGQFQF